MWDLIVFMERHSYSLRVNMPLDVATRRLGQYRRATRASGGSETLLLFPSGLLPRFA